MKPRFFGDTRDLFKYDMVQALMEGIPGLRRFLFVPMLTGDDGKEGGCHDLSKARAGYLNRDLLSFLGRCNREKERDVCRISSYFDGRGMDTATFARPFTRSGRVAYFGGLLAGLPPSALVLLDPDNGLETGHPGEKHLLFSELSSILAILDDASLVMVFQYYPRVNHGMYRAERLEEILRKTGLRPLWITDNQILFYLLAKTDPVRVQAAGVIALYAARYPGLAAGR